MEYSIIIIFDNGASHKYICSNGEQEQERIFETLRKNSHSVQMLHEKDYFIDMARVIFVVKGYNIKKVEPKKGWFS